jgi:hypothetical protein
VSTANLVAGQAEYDLPVDMIRMEWINVNGIPLESKSFAEIREQILQHESQVPTAAQPYFWYSWDDKIIFYPKPSESALAGITMYYYASPPVVSSVAATLPIPDRVYNRLCEYVLAQAYELDEDWAAAATKGQQFETGLTEMKEQENQPRTGVYGRITVLDEDL